MGLFPITYQLSYRGLSFTSVKVILVLAMFYTSTFTEDSFIERQCDAHDMRLSPYTDYRRIDDHYIM